MLGAEIDIENIKKHTFYNLIIIILGLLAFSGIVLSTTSLHKERFFVFFTVAFLLFLAPAGGSNPAGPIT